MRRFVRDIHGTFTEVYSEISDLPVRSSRRTSLNELFDHEEARIANHFFLTGEMPSGMPSKAESLALVEQMRAKGGLPPEAPAVEESRILTEDECRQRIERMKRSGTLPTFEQFHRVVEDALDKIDAERGDEPRERIFRRRIRRVQ